ncbi:MAG: PP2C family protein-serine/threonine phosphatase [Prevotella sp.]|nr:PP2C family protein-serine/threonine phosphatase [Prevotella sp.]
MRQTKIWIFLMVMAGILMAACNNEEQNGQMSEADKLIENTQKTKNYPELLKVVDSLETTGSITPTKAYYWRGYACDKMKRQRLAEFYWKASLDAAENATSSDEMAYYAKSASRLANMLSVRGDYQEGLDLTVPVANKLEELHCDSTSDYLNILIYIGCCQEGLGTANGNSDGFNKAYQRHKENIETFHNDVVYKDGITGLINITYNYIYAKKWQEALTWTTRFGQILSEYEQRPDADADFIDRQLARYDIYQALALLGLGQTEEAGKAYEKFQSTRYSNTPKGRIDANDYLTAANRWDEAAEHYSSLDAMMGETPQNYSLENIENLVLKKYHTNLLAGRRDSAIQVALNISNALSQAINKSKKIENEEQAVIVKTVEKMTEQEAKKNRKYQFMIAFGIAIVILCLIAYALIRRRMAHQLQAAYEDLKYDYDRMEADTAVKEREASEFRIAQNIQRVIAPRLLPKYKSFDLWSAIKMGQMEGGGVMDYCVRDGKLFFCVGESGVEGVKASLLTTIVKAQFRTAATFESQPDKIMSAINNALAQKENKGIDIRLIIGVLDIYNGKLYFCNASHAAPLLVSNELHHLPVEQNVAIGEEPNYAYEAQEITMLPGTMIFLNTEGLIKVKNAEHRVFNEKRMLGSALQAMKLDPRPKPFIENMLDAVHRFAGDFEQRDDMALLAIRFKGATKLEQKADEDLEPEVEPEVEAPAAPQQPEPAIATEPIPEPQVFEEPKVYDEPEFYDEPDVIIEDAEATEIQ